MEYLDSFFSLVKFVEEFIEKLLLEFLEKSIFKIPGRFSESISCVDVFSVQKHVNN